MLALIRRLATTAGTATIQIGRRPRMGASGTLGPRRVRLARTIRVMPDETPEVTGFRSVLSVREFRWLWLASIQSMAGDQLARVALSVLVYERTKSGLWTALVYALTFLPALAGGLLFAGIADRRPRRAVAVACAVGQAVLLGAMALPGAPLWVLGALLTVATLVGAVFSPTEGALAADIITGPLYPTAAGLRQATFQAAQVLGFAAGGAAVAVLGARSALAVDAITFAISALVLRVALASRPAPGGEAAAGSHWWSNMTSGTRLLLADARLRSLLAFACLTVCWIVPEGLAAPYASEAGGGPISVGILLAANPLGNVVGAIAFVRWVPTRLRAPLLGPLAVSCGVPLLVCAARPGVVVTAVLWAVAGLGSAYQVQLSTECVAATDPSTRARVFGAFGAGLLAAQGIGLLVGGAVAQAWSTPAAIALAGALGAALAVWLTVRRARLLAGPGSSFAPAAP